MIYLNNFVGRDFEKINKKKIITKKKQKKTVFLLIFFVIPSDRIFKIYKGTVNKNLRYLSQNTQEKIEF